MEFQARRRQAGLICGNGRLRASSRLPLGRACEEREKQLIEHAMTEFEEARGSRQKDATLCEEDLTLDCLPIE